MWDGILFRLAWTTPHDTKLTDPAICSISTAFLYCLPSRTASAEALRDSGIFIPEWKIHRRIGMSGSALVRQLVREPQNAPLKNQHGETREKARRPLQQIPEYHRATSGSGRTAASPRHSRRTMGHRDHGPEKQTKKLLRKLRIPATAVVITGDDVAKAKPSPDVFVAAADGLGIPVENCIVVGDSIWDMLAAGRRRALAVGLLSGGYSQSELEQAGAFRVYTDPAGMLEHIEDVGLG